MVGHFGGVKGVDQDVLNGLLGILPGIHVFIYELRS